MTRDCALLKLQRDVCTKSYLVLVRVHLHQNMFLDIHVCMYVCMCFNQFLYIILKLFVLIHTSPLSFLIHSEHMCVRTRWGLTKPLRYIHLEIRFLPSFCISGIIAVVLPATLINFIVLLSGGYFTPAFAFVQR